MHMDRKNIALMAVLLILIAAVVSWGLVSRVFPAQAQAAPTATSAPTAAAPANASEVLTALETTLEQVYNQVNPSVVNIQVVKQVSLSEMQIPGFNLGPDTQGQQQTQGEGSGFVWDTQGHIVTNDHVVDGATKIQVIFYDGTTVNATLVGTDPSSDLAVVKVDVSADQLHPVQLADSTQLKVGEVSIAIGNPFGLNGTMTVGFISALDRSMPSQLEQEGTSYTIPDVIQTDASINPGNSGGVLLNDSGQVIGVTAAIESTSGSNSGVGFAIPSAIVQKVVPALIETGHYDHPWLGVSGTSLTPDLAEAMGLPADQRGALVMSTVADGPAAQAGLQGSDQQATINGEQVQVGGDVIVAFNGTVVKDFDSLVSYLADSTSAGQKVTLTVLRGGKEMTVDVTLGVRPDTIETAQNTQQPQSPTQGRSYLGILGINMSAEIAKEMGVSENQAGVLVEQVRSNTPAEQAGLQGGNKTVTINGQAIVVGGDIITALNEQPVANQADLQSLLAQVQPGAEATLTVLRDGQPVDLSITLAERPGNLPE